MANKDIKLFVPLVSGLHRYLQELELRNRKNLRDHLRHSDDQDKG